MVLTPTASVGLALWHARQVLGLLARAGELQESPKDADTDYHPLVSARIALIAHGLDKNFPLPDDTREYLLSLLDREPPERRAKGRGRWNPTEIRDRWIAGVVNHIAHKCGLHATRGEASANVSACGVVAMVLREFRKKGLSERRVCDIYLKCKKRGTAYDVSAILARVKTLGELQFRAKELRDTYLRKEN
jgi:hypothetical protein